VGAGHRRTATRSWFPATPTSLPVPAWPSQSKARRKRQRPWRQTPTTRAARASLQADRRMRKRVRDTNTRRRLALYLPFGKYLCAMPYRR
jgi:hypothetical protein